MSKFVKTYKNNIHLRIPHGGGQEQIDIDTAVNAVNLNYRINERTKSFLKNTLSHWKPICRFLTDRVEHHAPSNALNLY